MEAQRGREGMRAAAREPFSAPPSINQEEQTRPRLPGRRAGGRAGVGAKASVNVALRVPPKLLVFSSAVKCLLSNSLLLN